MRIPVDPRARELMALLARDGYERWLAKEIERILQESFDEVVSMLRDRNADLTADQRERLSVVGQRIRRELEFGYGRVSQFSTEQLSGFSKIEFDGAKLYLDKLLGTDASPVGLSLDVFAPERVRAIANLPIEGLSIGEWWNREHINMTYQTRAVIQVGLTRGESIPKIVNRIMPPKTDETTPAVWRRARAGARSTVRTAITTVSNQASLESYQKAGDDVSDSYRYSAIRDARTTPICRALDGNIYRYDDPKKKVPPQHYGCRSTTIPIVKWAELGIDVPPGANSPMTLQSYDAWLREKPSGLIDRILGPARGRMYRDGRVGLADLVNSDGRQYTLTQLAARLKEAAGT